MSLLEVGGKRSMSTLHRSQRGGCERQDDFHSHQHFHRLSHAGLKSGSGTKRVISLSTLKGLVLGGRHTHNPHTPEFEDILKKQRNRLLLWFSRGKSTF